METPKLYGDSRSGNCYKAALLMRLIGMPFEWVETDVLSKQTRKEEFLALNPNGKVPLMTWPDGRCLAESNAMLLHLARDTPYFPADPWLQAQVWQWLFFEQYSHEPYVAVVRFIVCLAKQEQEQAERLVGLRERAYQALDVMEASLVNAPYFAGQVFTVADIALYAYTHVAEEAGFSLRAYPAVKTWLSRVESQSGFLPMVQACR